MQIEILPRLGALVRGWRAVASMLSLGGFASVGLAQSAAISMPTTIARPDRGSATHTIQLTGDSPGGTLQYYRYAVVRPDGTGQSSINWTPFSPVMTVQWTASGYWNQVPADTDTDRFTGFADDAGAAALPTVPTWIDTSGNQEVSTADSLATGSATGTIVVAATDALGLYRVKLDVQDASGGQASAAGAYQLVAAEPALSSDALAAKNGKPSESATSKAKSTSGSGRIIASSLRSGPGTLAERASLAADSATPRGQAASIGNDLVIRTPKSGFYRVKTSDWTIASVSAP